MENTIFIYNSKSDTRYYISLVIQNSIVLNIISMKNENKLILLFSIESMAFLEEQENGREVFLIKSTIHHHSIDLMS